MTGKITGHAHNAKTSKITVPDEFALRLRRLLNCRFYRWIGLHKRGFRSRGRPFNWLRGRFSHYDHVVKGTLVVEGVNYSVFEGARDRVFARV